MDVLDEDLINFWKELHAKQVEYIMVGGFAAILHGASRITQDVDIWIKDTKENRSKFRQAICNLGLGDFKELESMEFIPGWTSIYLFQGLELDIMTYLKAFPQTSFESSFSKASIATIEGIPIYFLHINQLLEEKKANARPKDLVDIEELEKIIALKTNTDT
ncbi:MAG: hypothetical protein K9H61_09550 [Bacteroidia bacterium]|nr:hypothetical protein [Bacteroidia bacterium]MCF8427343.1 hypothetical protein [Bacteroidia bacterium]MCF8447225.1 hypothetical protein [Bacteroidia bacterium]